MKSRLELFGRCPPGGDGEKWLAEGNNRNNDESIPQELAEGKPQKERRQVQSVKSGNKNEGITKKRNSGKKETIFAPAVEKILSRDIVLPFFSFTVLGVERPSFFGQNKNEKSADDIPNERKNDDQGRIIAKADEPQNNAVQRNRYWRGGKNS